MTGETAVMIFLWIIAVILIILIIISLLPVALDIYFDGEFSMKARVGPFPIRLDKEKKAGEDLPNESEEKNSGGKVGRLKSYFLSKNGKVKPLELVKTALKALGRFRRKLCVKSLMLHFTAAADDPYEAAMQYGRANAVIAAMIPLAYSALRIKKCDITTNVDFERTSPGVEASCSFSVYVWEIIYIAAGLAVGFLKARDKTDKTETKGGSPETES